MMPAGEAAVSPRSRPGRAPRDAVTARAMPAPEDALISALAGAAGAPRDRPGRRPGVLRRGAAGPLPRPGRGGGEARHAPRGRRPSHWKSARTPNAIERPHEESKRGIKTRSDARRGDGDCAVLVGFAGGLDEDVSADGPPRTGGDDHADARRPGAAGDRSVDPLLPLISGVGGGSGTLRQSWKNGRNQAFLKLFWLDGGQNHGHNSLNHSATLGPPTPPMVSRIDGRRRRAFDRSSPVW